MIHFSICWPNIIKINWECNGRINCKVLFTFPRSIYLVCCKCNDEWCFLWKWCKISKIAMVSGTSAVANAFIGICRINPRQCSFFCIRQQTVPATAPWTPLRLAGGQQRFVAARSDKEWLFWFPFLFSHLLFGNVRIDNDRWTRL